MSVIVVIIMGSPSDVEFSQGITQALDSFGIPWETRVASAHKVPRHVLEMLEAYEADPQPKVYITVAGRSNALSGLVDFQVSAPVIACPPYSDKFAGNDVYSSLRMPSGVGPPLVRGAQNPARRAALLAAKILSLVDASLREKVKETQEKQRQRLLEADAALNG
jgi:5-(carboxyamino)imidazole ribonucleotide mutase